MRKYFGTDGIRRIANSELTPELVYRVAKAGAYVLSKHTDHTPTIFIGRDTRISGTLIEAAMTAGFLSYGANVKLLGVLPTPGVAYLTRRYKADASVVISASHNTFEFNGIKYFSNKGMKIPDALEEAGISHTCISLYHTVTDERKADELNRLIKMADYVTFASSSAVRAFVSMVDNLDEVKGKYISIGPVTTKTAQENGLSIAKTAVVYTARGMVETMIQDAVEEGQK